MGSHSRSSRGWSTVGILIAVVLIAVACRPPLVPPPQGPGSHLPVIACSAGPERVIVTVSSALDPSCTYTAGFDVTASGTTLDCRGAIIDGTGRGGAGILVHAPAEADLADVTIRNCVVQGFLNSIRVTRDGFRSLTAGHEYDHGVTGVVIEGSKVGGSHGVGIYVDGYVTRTTIRHDVIDGAGSSGIYLEAGSADNVVEQNTIRNNGYIENGPGGQLVTFAGAQFRFWGIGREGISIDGSRRNQVIGNSFSGNSAGGVFLYTNCSEYVHQRPDTWFPRRYGADDNVISGNVVRRWHQRRLGRFPHG